MSQEVLVGRRHWWHWRHVATPGDILGIDVRDVPWLICRGRPSSLYLSTFTGREGQNPLKLPHLGTLAKYKAP